jgi:hypothetical protein
VEEDLINVFGRVAEGSPVTVSSYTLPATVIRPKPLTYYKLRPASQPMKPAYDNESLPRYLFLGASLMTLGTLIALCRRLPDFFVRALLWLRSHGRHRPRVVGHPNLPCEGAAILATNCQNFEDALQLVSATDRFTRVVLIETDEDDQFRPFLRYLARRAGMVVLRVGQTDAADWDRAYAKASKALKDGNLVALTMDSMEPEGPVGRLVEQLQSAAGLVPVLPVYCGPLSEGENPGHSGRNQIVFGHLMKPGRSVEDYRAAIRRLRDHTEERDFAAEASFPH